MQVNPEECAALERLRCAERDGHLEGAYGSISMTDSWTIMRNADRKTAADLALRLVREDDEEAITEEWLRSVCDTDASVDGLFIPTEDDEIGINFYQNRIGEWRAQIGEGGETWPIAIHTRGQLRRLASCLGIELEDPS